MLAGFGDRVGGGKQKSTLSSYSWNDNVPAFTSMIAPVVTRNGLPKMTGT